MAKKGALKEQNGNPPKIQESSSNAFTGFAQETRQELTKVVWPSRQQLISESAAVMLMVTLVATIVYLVDNIFGWAAGKVF